MRRQRALPSFEFGGDSGRARFFRDYVAAFREIAAEQGITGIERFSVGDAVGAVAAPEAEHWDAVLIVRYPSIAAFRAIVATAPLIEIVPNHTD